MHFTEKKVKNMRSVTSASIAKKQLHQLLHLSMLNKGVSLPSRFLTANSTVMTENEIQTFINAFKESMEWLKPLIKVTAPELIA